jgi:hypothetical protein
MTFHERLAFELFFVQVALGVWALILWRRKQPSARFFVYGLIIDEGLILIQSFAGALLFTSGHRPQLIHFLYAGLLIVLLPAVYPLSQRRPLVGPGAIVHGGPYHPRKYDRHGLIRRRARTPFHSCPGPR